MKDDIEILAEDEQEVPPFEDRRKADRRQNVVDRRTGLDRRNAAAEIPGLDRRRGPGRRRTDDRKAAEEGEMTDEQFEFLMAIEQYKKQNNRPFPTWTEVLEVMKALGYRKVAKPGKLSHAKEDRKEQTQPA